VVNPLHDHDYGRHELSFGISTHVAGTLYTLPTLFSAYFFGRRHATLTAFASDFNSEHRNLL
jgi:hypothetical protein